MLLQHSIEQSETQGEPRGHAEQEGIVVPLELGEFRLLKQHLQEDGSIEVEVIAKTDRARCPHYCAGAAQAAVPVSDVSTQFHRTGSGVWQATTHHQTLT